MNSEEKILNRARVKLLLHKIGNSLSLAGVGRTVRYIFERYVATIVYPRYTFLHLERQSYFAVPHNVDPHLQIKQYREMDDLPILTIQEIDQLITYSNMKTFKNSFEKSSLLWIASIENRLCGYCWSMAQSRNPSVHNPGVEQYLYDVEIFIPFRGIGLGPRMIEIICKNLFENSTCRSIWTKVHSLNNPSLHMFYKCGFITDTAKSKKQG